ncbi:MAG: type II restriction endonuclease [Patescibacteria group bacterium]|jgi:hypothetical protein
MNKEFANLVGSFKNSIKTWDYFINWDKVSANTSALEISLNKLNYLLGKDNLKEEFVKLYKTNPDIITALPVLLAVRDNNLEIYNQDTKESEFFDFTNNDNDADKYFKFLKESGLVRLFQRDGVKNLVDYVMGVEVGLDSHGRKNRGGMIMEEIVEPYIKNFTKKRGYEYLAQARATNIKEQWGLEIKVDKSERIFDFAIYNPQTRSIKLLETNFFNGGGTKIKTVCGEFRGLYDELKKQGIEFIWITDGFGWQSTKRPLEETFNNNQGKIFNLNMLEEGILDKLTW